MKKILIPIFAAVLILGGVAQAQTTTNSTSTQVSTTTTATPTPTSTTTPTSTPTSTPTATPTVSPVATSSSQSELVSLIRQMNTLRERIITILIQDLSTAQTKADKIVLLQTLLALDKNLYPEGVITGNLGGLTKKAILRFVNKNSVQLSTTTNTILRGPAYLLQNGAGNSGKVPQGLKTAPGIAKKLGTPESSTTSTSSEPKGGIKKLIKIFKK